MGPAHCDTVATRYNLHVLESDMEQEASRGIWGHFTQFFARTFVPEAQAPSLLSLLCEESAEQGDDGPVDDPLCCACRTANSLHASSRRRPQAMPLAGTPAVASEL